MLPCYLYITVPELTAKEHILSAYKILAKHGKISENYDKVLISVFGLSWTCRVDGGLPVSRCGHPVIVWSLSSHV